MSSLSFLDDSNPILSSLPFSQCPYCAVVVVESSVGTDLGQVSFTDVSICHDHCFMPSYSMSMSSFSSGVQVGPLSGSTRNTLPRHSHPSLCSSCCSIDHDGILSRTSGSVDTEDLTCYTIHDDNIRAYLSDPTNGCLGSSDIETNGVISVATLRSSLSCPSSSLSLSSIATDMLLSSVNSITTLQGLEYATSLTSLTVDGYDLSNVNDSYEYDKLVIQILAKAVTSGTIDSGLKSLSASGCNLSAVSDVLDLTPINENDTATQPFKLTSLDLSNNSISDVSVLITSDLFPADTLTTLDISGNSICNIDNVVSALQTKFTNLSSVTYSDQTCHCSASVSSSSFQVCREVYPDRWAVECWNGYYLDKASGECVAACPSGTVLDTSESCTGAQ
ncbi:hypothetical protein ADUPG1_000947 [Aduncisulcus paluster]|uniref:Uncharacterized protein n=1 Tax=Aduncisulcus paluster TaxID=2918883 RepID=A0ABQ5KC64_9EUKA|nr:hypothetical protein ADUPG1_000947 [Aduncisulcus paluster]